MSDLDSATTSLAQLIDLTGKVAVVTGAASGIGRASARRLAEAGAQVWGADRAYPEATRPDDPWTPVSVDVTDPPSIAALCKKIDEQAGRLDIWVNAAGVFPRGGVLELGVDDWHAVFAVNVDGTLLCSQHAAQRMVDAGHGVIVNVSSTVAHRVNHNAAHYRASKAAIIALTQNLAVELGHHGVRALAVCPTLTLTEGVARLAGSGDAAGLEAYGRRLPLGRAASADDVARVVLFAATPLAGYMTGNALVVDGGEMQR